ncbi:hypothetical protein [Luteolibacter soli]|uniref:DUF2946 domain-containing protein n=1 Tax=Luteolibacter soli TaxID=3135280 RepID=A0ABU9AYA7_9BACT
MIYNRGFLVSVRSVFAWLMVFGVIAGLCARVLDLDHVHPKGVQTECCGHDHDAGDDDHHSSDCPPGPHSHHTHACCHPAPLAGVELLAQRQVSLDAQWLGVSWASARPPDEPVFALDKPPLI